MVPSFSDFVDRILHERWVRFWTVVSGVAAVLALVVAVVVALNGTGRSTSLGTEPASSGPTKQNGTSGSTISAQASRSQIAPPAVGVTYLQLDPVTPEWKGSWGTGPVVIDGREYQQSIKTIHPCAQDIEYALSAHYSRFRGIAGFADDSPTVDAKPLKITVDGVAKLSGTIELRKPITIDLDVRGAVRLGIIIGICVGATVAIGDPRLESQS